MKKLLTCTALLTVAACATPDPAPPTTPVSIMTFNVENLFDTVDDPGKNDETFLPLTLKRNDAHRAKCATIEVDRWRDQCLNWDWNDALLERKLEVVAAAIRQVDDGRGPDIVALQEIENLEILDRLRLEYLADAGYRAPVLIEGQDLRGIDVAFLSRLPLAEPPTLHALAFTPEFADRAGDTRGLLEATFALPGGGRLTGYAVHFPAPFHPTPMRVSAYEALNERLAALPADRPVFAAGDFNTTSAEDAREDLLGRYARPHWTVAHELGCGEDCRGTSYYARDDSWSFLDMLLWSPSRRGADATCRLDRTSVRLVNALPEQRRENRTPARFDAVTGAGVSDHWPLLMRVNCL